MPQTNRHDSVNKTDRVAEMGLQVVDLVECEEAATRSKRAQTEKKQN